MTFVDLVVLVVSLNLLIGTICFIISLFGG